MDELKSGELAARAEKAIWLMLGVLPYCNIVRVPPNPSFWGQLTAVVLILAWCLLQAAQIRFPMRRSLTLPAVCLTGLAAWLALQAIFGLTPPSNVWMACAGLTLAAWCVGLGAALTPQRARELTGAFAFGLAAAIVLNAIAVLLGWFGREVLMFSIYETSTPGRAVGLIGQSNHLGELAVLAFAGGIFLYSERRLSLWAFLTVALLSIVVNVSSGSRIGLLLWLLPAGIAFIVSRRSSIRDSREFRPITWRIGLAILVMFLSAALVWHALAARVASPGGSAVARATDHNRLALMSDAVSLWVRHPITGVGQGRFAESRLHELSTSLVEHQADHAHNLFLHALAEWGAVGAIIVVLALVLVVIGTVRTLRNSDCTPTAVFAGTSVACLLLHSMVEHPLWFMYFLLPFAVFAGRMVQPLKWLGKSAAVRTGHAWQVTASISLLVAAVVGYDYWRHQTLALRLMGDLLTSSDGKVHVPLADAAKIADMTAFPGQASIMLSRTLPLNPDVVELKLQITRRAMATVVNEETIARHLAFSVVAGQEGYASDMLKSIRHRASELHGHTWKILAEFAKSNPAVRQFMLGQQPPEPLSNAVK
jgi:O-antigen ligase